LGVLGKFSAQLYTFGNFRTCRYLVNFELLEMVSGIYVLYIHNTIGMDSDRV
jgi:hypothetical protein